jgi:catechol 2,3-dioxygenase-like lactoylglutathione lyase family enzyme
MAIEINGIAHLMLTVSDFERCRPFYARLLEFMGLVPLIDADGAFYCIGGRTAVGIMACADEHRGERFVQQRVGLHHACFRARAREDVDALHGLLQDMGANIVHPPEEGPWAPGYYSVLFEDPDGTRLEMNHVPGKGHLEESGSTQPEKTS